MSNLDLDRLRVRREARRRQLRRRRRRALAAAALVVCAIVAVSVSLAAGGGSPKPRPSGAVANAATAVSRSGRASRAAGRSVPASRTSRRTAVTHAHVRIARGGAPASPTGRPGTQPVPLLMYHVINSPPTGAPFPGLYVDPSEFAAQMQALAAAGWHAVTLDQVEAYWRHGTPLPPGRPIVITFDNGYHSQYSNALPILRRLGWVGDLNIQLTGLPPSQGGLSAAEVSALLRAGWELDTQGFSHADLVTLDQSQLEYQVAAARRVLQERYHVPVDWFCYPSGHYDATVIDAVKAAGYVGSTTVIPGWSSPGQDPYRLERIRVLRGTSPQALLSLIAGVRSDPPPPASYGLAS